MDKLIYETGFGIISKSLVCNPNLSSEAKSLFAYFAAYAGNGDTAFPSVELILYHMNWSKTKFYKYRNELEEKGYLKVEQIKEKGKFAHNIYRLIAIPVENTTKSPCPKNSDTVKRDTVFPDTGNKDTKRNSLNKNSINKNSSINKKETSLDKLIKDYTENEDLKEVLIDFIKMRKAIKSPATDRALKGILNKLDHLSNEDETKIGILEQSIINSWKSVFPLKEQNSFSTNSVSKNNNNIRNQYNKGAGANVNETFRNYDPSTINELAMREQQEKINKLKNK